ncbi:MAG TPA: hypothetical protein VHI52_11105, partial [Verrucomicrobiae bacterium]|nr:hypothetical protein [Verrucomicrobiae bacterium]
SLDLSYNRLTRFDLSPSLTDLSQLNLTDNELTDLRLPSGMSHLTTISVPGNQLSSLDLPRGLTSLSGLDVSDNLLTNFTLQADLGQLSSLDLHSNYLTGLTIPSGLNQLQYVNPFQNNLPGIRVGAGNPLLTPFLTSLREAGASVTLFPAATPPALVGGTATLQVFGDAGEVVVERSTDLKGWTPVGSVVVGTANYPGVTFLDTNGPPAGQAFYRLMVPLK